MLPVTNQQSIEARKTITFTQAIKSGFSNYVNFTGRAARSEFWYWTLFTFLIGVAINIVDYGLGSGSGLLGELWGLAIFFTDLAVGVAAARLLDAVINLQGNVVSCGPSFASRHRGCIRRLHDIDRSGWWFLIAFTIIGLFVLFYWACKRGTPGPNRFGPDPFDTINLSPRPTA